MLGSKRLVLIGVGFTCACLAASAAIIVFEWTQHGSSNTPHKKPVSDVSKVGAPAPAAIKYKLASGLVDDKAVAGILGASAVKNTKFTVFTTAAYSSSRCEYTVDNKKASLILYQYPDDKQAGAGKGSAQTQVRVASADGRSSSMQPRQSVVGQKGTYLVSAAVTDGGSFDGAKSQALLAKAIEGLK